MIRQRQGTEKKSPKHRKRKATGRQECGTEIAASDKKETALPDFSTPMDGVDRQSSPQAAWDTSPGTYENLPQDYIDALECGTVHGSTMTAANQHGETITSIVGFHETHASVASKRNRCRSTPLDESQVEKQPLFGYGDGKRHPTFDAPHWQPLLKGTTRPTARAIHRGDGKKDRFTGEIL